MSPLVKKIVIAASLLIFIYVTTGYVLGRSSDDQAFRALTVYTEVLEHIQRDYVDDPNIHSVTNGALHGLLDSLDPQSGYMSPLEYADFKEKSADQNKAAAGITVSKRFDYLTVVSTLPDSPAAKANLQMGDIIEKIAGFTTAQMAIDQAQVLFTGEPGTSVKLSVIKRGKTEPQDVDVTLEKLSPPKLVEDKIQGDIAYLRVPEFTTGMTNQIRDQLLQFDRQGEHRLVLDLRNCSAGDDREGISTAELFVSGKIATLKGQTVTPVVSMGDPSKVVWKQPVTVLIGNGTAGPAELVAAAIGDNHRGETIGDRTYGTASEQKLIQLNDGSALILTIANYYTPNGKEVPVDGVAPTVPVLPSPDDLAAENYPPPPSSSLTDPVVKKAVDVLTQGSAGKKAA